MSQLNIVGVLLSLGLGVYLLISQQGLYDKVDKLSFEIQQAAKISEIMETVGDTSKMAIPRTLQGDNLPSSIRFPKKFFCLQGDLPFADRDVVTPAMLYFDGQGGFAYWEGLEKISEMETEAETEAEPSIGKAVPTLRGTYEISGYDVFVLAQEERGFVRRRKFEIVFFDETGDVTDVAYKSNHFAIKACSWNNPNWNKDL